MVAAPHLVAEGDYSWSGGGGWCQAGTVSPDGGPRGVEVWSGGKQGSE